MGSDNKSPRYYRNFDVISHRSDEEVGSRLMSKRKAIDASVVSLIYTGN